MYRGFNLLLEDNCFEEGDFEAFKKVGSESFLSQKTSIEEKINSFIGDDGSLDGSMMQANWFPQKRRIFLYHTHIKMRNLLLPLLDG